MIETIDLIRYIILTVLLIPVIVIDIKKHIIPNGINLAGAIIAIVLTFFDRVNFETYIWGMVFGLGFFVAIIVLSELILKRQGMGEGDAKLMGVIGLFLGLPYTIVTTFLSFLIGAVFSIFALLTKKGKFGQELPFGPFIAIAAMITMIWGNNIIGWYIGV